MKHTKKQQKKLWSLGLVQLVLMNLDTGKPLEAEAVKEDKREQEAKK